MIDIRPFDPSSATRTEWNAVHVFRYARNEEDTPGEALFDEAEFERQTRHQWPLYEERRWYAWAGDEIAGVIGASFRRGGTANYDIHAPHLYAWCSVRKHQRRRRFATGLLRPLLNFMDERNKTLATLDTSTSDGEAFLSAVGATLKQRSIENRAPFDGLDWAKLDRWHAAATSMTAPLHWEIHVGRVPLDKLEATILQYNALLADIPLGDLESPPPRWDLTECLTWYEELDGHIGDHILVMLMDGDTVAAVSEVVWDSRFPDHLYQRLTAVARPWRGRGLAKGVKAAMMQVVRDRRPDIKFVMTSNANMNAPMLSINEQLGFREHRRTAVYQVGPEAISTYLMSRG